MMKTKTEKTWSPASIRMIALDLDGTTLTRDGLTRRTKETLEEAIRRGIHVVIATGRTYTALPERVHQIQGLEYIITSNGAHISEAQTGKFIYSNYASAEAVDRVLDILENTSYPVEVFTEGRAYIGQDVYTDLEAGGKTTEYMNPRYVLRTRNPVENIYLFLREHREKIENINVHFELQEERMRMWETFSKIPNVTVTSSHRHNVEIGGKTTSKATALAEVCRMLNLDLSHVMAFGDGANDIAMLTECGFGVAMGNASEDVIAAADHVTLSNDEEGVAYTIRTMLFDEDGGVSPGSADGTFRSWLLAKLKSFWK